MRLAASPARARQPGVGLGCGQAFAVGGDAAVERGAIGAGLPRQRPRHVRRRIRRGDLARVGGAVGDGGHRGFGAGAVGVRASATSSAMRWARMSGLRAGWRGVRARRRRDLPGVGRRAAVSARCPGGGAGGLRRPLAWAMRLVDRGAGSFGVVQRFGRGRAGGLGAARRFRRTRHSAAAAAVPVAIKPSQRRSWPSRVTMRWPTARCYWPSVSTTDLREPAGERAGARRHALPTVRASAGGQGRLRGARRLPMRRADVEIVAERGGDCAFVAGAGGDVVGNRSRPLRCVCLGGECRHFAVDRGEICAGALN